MHCRGKVCHEFGGMGNVQTWVGNEYTTPEDLGFQMARCDLCSGFWDVPVNCVIQQARLRGHGFKKRRGVVS